MTYWQETKGARALREQTNDALDAHDIAPTPENYELLFHYTLAHDLDLKSALKEAFAVERGAMLELLDQIHTKFFRSSSGENLNQSEQEFEAQLRQFSEVLAAADRGSLTFGNTLDLAAAQMSRAGAPDHLHSLLQSLASATRLMSEQNRELKAQVQETSGEVAALRSKMDVIRQEALVDALTGLANRRAFDRTLALAVQYARSESTPLCVLMCADR